MELPFNPEIEIKRIVMIPCYVTDRRTGEAEYMEFYRENIGNLFGTLKKELNAYGYDVQLNPGRKQKEITLNMKEIFESDEPEPEPEPNPEPVPDLEPEPEPGTDPEEPDKPDKPEENNQR